MAKQYNTINRKGEVVTIELPETMFTALKDRLFDSLSHKDGIRSSDFVGSAEDCKEAFSLYKQYSVEVQSAVAHLAIAAKRGQTDKVAECTDMVNKAFGHYVTIFGADLCLFGANAAEALLPHIGTFRKVSGTESEYQFMIAGEASFRKSLERVVADFIKKGHILTVEERREARKAAAKAKREAKKIVIAD